jgi:zinc protease
MRHSFALAAITFLMGQQAPAQSQAPSKLPKAETVLDDYIEATGGKAAYEKLKNLQVLGTIEVANLNVKGSIKITQAAPNQMVVETEIGPAGKTIQGTDGKSAWMLSQVIGNRLVEGPEKEELLKQATFNDDLHWRDLYEKAECTGIEDVDGKPAYKVVMTPKSGPPVTKYYDTASHLLVKESRTSKSPLGEITAESYAKDYKKVGGVLMPFTQTQKAAGQTIEIKVAEIKHNLDLPADTFKVPAALDRPATKK